MAKGLSRSRTELPLRCRRIVQVLKKCIKKFVDRQWSVDDDHSFEKKKIGHKHPYHYRVYDTRYLRSSISRGGRQKYPINPVHFSFSLRSVTLCSRAIHAVLADGASASARGHVRSREWNRVHVWPFSFFFPTILCVLSSILLPSVAFIPSRKPDRLAYISHIRLDTYIDIQICLYISIHIVYVYICVHIYIHFDSKRSIKWSFDFILKKVTKRQYKNYISQSDL